MAYDLSPVPEGDIRQHTAARVRDEATSVSKARAAGKAPDNNGEASAALDGPHDGTVAAFGTFTKGLSHDAYGRVSREDLKRLISEINQDAPGSALGETPLPGTYASGLPAAFDVPKHVAGYTWDAAGPEARAWESPLAGHTFDLEGADAGQVAIPPAPVLGSPELTAEMAEVYEMALIRDVPFHAWASDGKVAAAVSALAALPFYASATGLEPGPARRRQARLMGSALSAQTLFRGSTPGAQEGPYVSQFLLIGNAERAEGPTQAAKAARATPSRDALTRSAAHVPPEIKGAAARSGGGGTAATPQDGFIRYGPQAIPQHFRPHEEGRDHMTDWASWRDVQNGANRKGYDLYLGQEAGMPRARFIATPRDLATYVHFDALYQAYLNACLILLGMEAPTDIGLPEGPNHATRDGFALFGGPHVLTLVCEVATRALKAVRRQKYNVHLRARPEMVGAGIALAWNGEHDALGALDQPLTDMAGALGGVLGRVAAHNAAQNATWTAAGWPVSEGPLQADKLGLLPMAFPEGSPMHPAYGAGHATVAGACVTVLKAFFEMYQVSGGTGFEDGTARRGKLSVKPFATGPQPARPDHLFGDRLMLTGTGGVGTYEADGQSVPLGVFVADPDAPALKPWDGYAPGRNDLSIEGELDKLAANISIGRNFAGVHYYTDYFESARMGERIAISMLQEQMLTYREPVSMRLTSFDGDSIMLIGTGGTRGLDDAPVLIWDADGQPVALADWWSRHA